MLSEHKRKILQHQSDMILNRHSEGTPFNKTDLQRLIFSEVKLIDLDNYNYKINEMASANDARNLIAINDLIGQLSPREFSQIFPITKEYDGHKYGAKDYFSVTEYINSFGWDTMIGNGFEFVMEYLNEDVQDLCVATMMVVAHSTPDLDIFSVLDHLEGGINR